MYTEYPKPIPVEFFNSTGFHAGEAIGVHEIPLTNGKAKFNFLVRLKDGSAAMVNQKDILPRPGTESHT